MRKDVDARHEAGHDEVRGRCVTSIEKKTADENVHLIVARDEEVVIEHHPEDWLVFTIFWALAFIVFLQFFTRYVLNDSLAWTEEIARYGLMWIVFVGGAMVTRRNSHIAVELISNVMKPGPLRSTLLAFVDVVKLAFIGLLAWLSVTILDRMTIQRMTVFDLPMSYVYAGVALGCFLMLLRQIQTLWRNARVGWRKPHELTDQIHAD